jgi:hypothetical protein
MPTRRGQPSENKEPASKQTRRKRRSSNRFQVTAHALDGLLKHEAEYLADALATHFHLPIPAIVRPFPTELPQLKLHLQRLDNVFETRDTALLHFEHQTDHTPETLPRFLQYDAALYAETKRDIRTVVIYGPNVRWAPSRIRTPALTYRVHNIYLGRRDGERVYRDLQRTLAAGTPLTSGQRIDLLFQPLMRQKRRPQEQVFRDAVAQAGQLPAPDQERAIASLLALAYHVLGESALNAMVEELMTTNLLVKVLGDQLEKGIQQGIERGREEGIVRARQQDILRILSRRYPILPDRLAARIEQTTDPDRLAALLDAVVDAPSLDEVYLALDS